MKCPDNDRPNLQKFFSACSPLTIQPDDISYRISKIVLTHQHNEKSNRKSGEGEGSDTIQKNVYEISVDFK